MTTQVRTVAVRWKEGREGSLEEDLDCGVGNSRLALGSLAFTDRTGRLRREWRMGLLRESWTLGRWKRLPNGASEWRLLKTWAWTWSEGWDWRRMGFRLMASRLQMTPWE